LHPQSLIYFFATGGVGCKALFTLDNFDAQYCNKNILRYKKIFLRHGYVKAKVSSHQKNQGK